VTALRLAHRGDWRRGPENTLPALLAGVQVPGCDGLEFDVRLARDGVPVLLHDETLARVHGRPGRVSDFPAAKLESFGITTLEAALAGVGQRPFLDVELKGREHGTVTADVLRRHRADDGSRAVVSSFQPDALRTMRGLLPGWSQWLNTFDLAPATIMLATELGCRGVSATWRAITDRSVARALDAGLEVAAWTVRRRQTYRRLERLGAVAICAEGAALDG
jgi:glycerophosphoryl diester phosphodiesterase